MFSFKNFSLDLTKLKELRSKIKYIQDMQIFSLSFVLACALWFIVVGSSQIEGDIHLRVEYTQLPENLIITKGLEDTIRVRVRASTELLRSLQNRDITYPVRLNQATVGANVFPVKVNAYGDFKGLEILSVSPSYLLLETDILLEKKVPIEISFTEKENEDLYIRNLNLSPSEVILRGPKEKLEAIDTLKVTFDINQIEKAGSHSKNLPLILPEFVEADNPVTTLSFETWYDLVPVNLTRLVQLEKGGENFITEPRTVNIELEIPESKVEAFNVEPSYMAQVRAIVQSSNAYTDGQLLPVHINLPKGANLISVNPQYVKIIKNKN